MHNTGLRYLHAMSEKLISNALVLLPDVLRTSCNMNEMPNVIVKMAVKKKTRS